MYIICTQLKEVTHQTIHLSVINSFIKRMPVLLSERMPLPSLRCYTLLSLVFLVSGFLHSMNAIEDRSTTLGEELENRGPGHENELSFFGNVSGYFSGKSSFYAWVWFYSFRPIVSLELLEFDNLKGFCPPKQRILAHYVNLPFLINWYINEQERK